MKHKLRLYVTGQSAYSQRAITNLKQLCETEIHEYDIEVIDVLEDPQSAEDNKILATPTLVKDLPPPIRKVVGDLSDRGQVLLGLDVSPPMESE